jgi:hypothetical protein
MKHLSGLHARLRNENSPCPNLRYHAEDCIRAAKRTVDPKRRDVLLGLAIKWREDAQALRNRRSIQKMTTLRKAGAVLCRA